MKGRGSLNHLYRLVWSQVLGAWIAVAETTKGRGKGASRKLLVAAVGLSSALAQAAPEGGQVVSGTGSIAQSGATTTITQTTQNLSLNWDSFNIAAQETVNFNQPSATAIAVNRIMDSNGTQILGNLNANGQVYLINPNGILFGQGAQVNVGALVASTLDLNDASLNSDSRSFSGNGAGSVINHGTLNAADGGYVALLGNTVSNQGTISAPLGTVALGAGSAATLTFADNSLVQMQVDQSLLNSLADNGGLIQADGGRVLMSAGAKDALLASVVNNTGVIEARSVENRDGVIVLLGGMQAGTVQVAGTLDASAPHGGDGGFIETSAAHVKVADNAKITTAAAHGKTGTWLIDPTDYTIAATDPGNGSSYMSNAALSTSLNTNNVTIQTLAAGSGNGDIHVNDAVSWSANNTLTLDAHRNINIKQSITATGDSGKLALKYGQGSTSGVIGGVAATYNVNAPVNLKAGDNFSTQLGSTGSVKSYTVITSLGAQGSTTKTDLQGINGGLTGNYALGSNIDASATSDWNGSAGFVPIGNSSTSFTGSFDGLGHSIANLSIDRPSTNYVGLFGYTREAAVIQNVGLVGGSVSGSYFVGGLVGNSYYSTISNSYTTGRVSGSSRVGGLVGISSNGSVSNSYATGSVSGSGDYVGGLVGHSERGKTNNSYATGVVTGSKSVGGLVGGNDGTISDSFADANVGGGTHVGGLVGNNTGDIQGSYALGTLLGGNRLGGLVGVNETGGIITTSYSSVAVTSNPARQDMFGGLVGQNAGAISKSYANGVMEVSPNQAGGLVGYNGGGTVTKSFWDTKITGQATSAGGIGLTTIDMQTLENFTSATEANANINPGWDFSDTWLLTIGSKAPLLKALMVDVTVTVDDVTKTYDGNIYSGGYSSTIEGHLPGTLSYTGSGQSAVNASSYVIKADAASYANKQYVITAIDGTLTINPADLTLSTSDVSKTYDAGLGAAGSLTVTGGALFGSDSVSGGTFAYTDKNAGTGNKIVTTGGVTVTDGNSGGNYSVSYADNTTSTINKADLSVTGLTVSNKSYDANTTASLGGSAAVAAFSGDDVTLAGVASGLFADKNAGTGKAVTVTGNSLSGTDAGNYNLRQQTGLSADIGKANLSVTGLTAGNKTYDAGTSATLGGTAAIAKLGDDDVSVVGSASGLFADKSVGTGKAVSVSGHTLSGGDAGNYNLLQQIGLTATISKADLVVSGITADSKVYDGNTGVSLNTAAASLSGLLAGDEVSVSAVGEFDSKNVGAGKTVALVSRYAGADLGNYRISDQGSTAAEITRATLTYAATPASFFSGQAPGALFGGVSGFVSGESLAGSTSGTPIWTTSASVNSQPGVYAINGGGLTASNYLFAQGAGNASALTLTSGTATSPVVNVTAQLAASVLSPQISSQPQALNLSPSVRVSQSANADSGAANDSSAADGNNGAAVNAQMTIGSAGPSLLIVSGGVRLPGNTVAEK